MLKRILIGLATLLGIVIISVSVIYHNFESHGYYYATHMPHKKGFYPVIRLISYKSLPNEVNTIYPSLINMSIREHNEDALGGGGGGIEKYNLFKKGDKWFIAGGGIAYQPDKNGQEMVTADSDYKGYISDIEDYNGKKINYSPKIDGVLDDITQRVKKVVKKPKVNLQWLYNKIYS
ncbi:hypothetical protein [Pediococcus argentinicus]|uniref:Uncharacterized protein n=1 Tax=Pediococcus argentinicus TaxID=480391 RepID=A0A0R2N4A5_9LACO|nr:hypothetical protein [Pediococcus argentinicus]KRO20565.1 hypothetical protein IV88_GL001578 [Pediococcus argentinicus]NKZ22891.1 hypothetical protein [Pediococcus argentinicus]GEP20385.1 hypothetical protein LSA03_17690 [Pediococcus argentinicus]